MGGSAHRRSREKTERKKTAATRTVITDGLAPLGAAAVATCQRAGSSGPATSAVAQQGGAALTRVLRGSMLKTALASSLRRWLASLPVPLQRLVAGGMSGALSKTASAPLETVRIRCMSTQASAGRAVMEIWSSSGPWGFFAGNSADLLRVVPSKSIELAAFDLYKTLFSAITAAPVFCAGRQGHGRGGEGSAVVQQQQQQQQAGAAETAAAGAAAGLTAQLLLFPLETVRTRMAASPALYPNVSATISLVVRSEGVHALYKGLDASLWGIIPYAALKLGLFDGIKWAWAQRTGERRVPPGVSAAAGAMAAVLATSATYPLEVARRRMMLGATYTSAAHALTAIATTEGFRALYAGLGLSVLKQAPQYAMGFAIYDVMKSAMSAPPLLQQGQQGQQQQQGAGRKGQQALQQASREEAGEAPSGNSSTGGSGLHVRPLESNAEEQQD